MTEAKYVAPEIVEAWLNYPGRVDNNIIHKDFIAGFGSGRNAARPDRDAAALEAALPRLLNCAAAMVAWLDDEHYDHSHGNPNVSMNEPCDGCIVEGMTRDTHAAIEALAALAARPDRDAAALRKAVESYVCGICQNCVGFDPDPTNSPYPPPCKSGGCSALRAALAAQDRTGGSNGE